MGRWLAALREHENAKTAEAGTAKTDKTQLGEVLSSVLAVPPRSVCKKSGEGIVSFGSTPSGFLQNAQPSPTPPAVAPEDWRAYFDERAGIREFDGMLSRSEAEAFALQDTVAALGPGPPNTRAEG